MIQQKYIDRLLEVKHQIIDSRKYSDSTVLFRYDYGKYSYYYLKHEPVPTLFIDKVIQLLKDNKSSEIYDLAYKTNFDSFQRSFYVNSILPIIRAIKLNKI